jgi:hypothetical protein
MDPDEPSVADPVEATKDPLEIPSLVSMTTSPLFPTRLEPLAIVTNPPSSIASPPSIFKCPPTRERPPNPDAKVIEPLLSSALTPLEMKTFPLFSMLVPVDKITSPLAPWLAPDCTTKEPLW